MTARAAIVDSDGDMTYMVEGYEGYVHLEISPVDGSDSLTVPQARALAAALEHFANEVEFRNA